MASYHMAVQMIRRSKGHSVVAAAAYRAGARLTDKRTGTVHDFSRRRGMVHSEIILPRGAAAWLGERERLWNHVEALENRKDAQLAREMNLALPHELEPEDRLQLVRDFIRAQFTSLGMVADFAIHQPVPEKGDNPHNHHAHIMLTLRGATREGLWRVKTREWNSDDLLNEWRAAWAEHQNRWLEFRSWETRVDHRTLGAQRDSAKERGDRAATELLDRQPEIHIGPTARAIVRDRREPESQDRTVRSRANRPRVRRYLQHDLGSRVNYALGRVERNLQRLDQKLSRWSARAMRFRQHQRRRWIEDHDEWEEYLFTQREAREHAWNQERTRRDKAWQLTRVRERKVWERRQRNLKAAKKLVGIGMFTPAPGLSAEHRERRRSLAARLLGDIDQVVAALMGGRSQLLRRRQTLVGQTRAAKRVRRTKAAGRGRARYPTFRPSTVR